MGPTASGKTDLAIKLCQIFPFSIVSVDSGLIYKGMDIGTAKPTLEDQKIAPHKLIDLLDPSQYYSVANFYHDVLIEIEKIVRMNRIPLLVGGSMLYFKVLLEGLYLLPEKNDDIRLRIKKYADYFGWNVIYQYLKKIDFQYVSKIHPNDVYRLTRALEIFLITGKKIKDHVKKKTFYDYIQICIFPENNSLLFDRIKKRFMHMLDLGFEEEVHSFYKREDLHNNLPSMRCVGYKQMWEYFSGKLKYHEMIHQAILATKTLAKHQITWLKKWKNIDLIIDDTNMNQAFKKVSNFIRHINIIKT
ncbi:MAG: tRNA (adenosine(37)-N6)-dimethylallyltransferase MiaA [Arsenophonus sp.]|nr:MAG: tRNA (adenosine(37)-N6)-dimethylallyltransferase MiaA [Arsenophonus sp.]